MLPHLLHPLPSRQSILVDHRSENDADHDREGCSTPYRLKNGQDRDTSNRWDRNLVAWTAVNSKLPPPRTKLLSSPRRSNEGLPVIRIMCWLYSGLPQAVKVRRVRRNETCRLVLAKELLYVVLCLTVVYKFIKFFELFVSLRLDESGTVVRIHTRELASSRNKWPQRRNKALWSQIAY